MASKVTCSNCGWSWNKSDSSKKDVYICHECGRDNSNKSEGWLDKYEQGGMVLKQKTEDNYGKKPNLNDVEATMPPGFVGMGNNTKGRNYSPAWGGQFQTGGFLQPTSDKLPEGYVIPYNTPSTELSMSIGGENGEPAYLIPSFKGGRKLKDPIAEYKKTGEHLGGPFKTWQEAEKFGEMRHKYVEKGQDIPTPIKTWGDMAMGGNIPGSVGFTYARTGDIPSNGKYAKKTLASAQKGKSVFKAPDLPEYMKGKESTAITQPSIPLSDVEISRNKFRNTALRAKDKFSKITLSDWLIPGKLLAKQELSNLGENLDPFAYSAPGEKGVVSPTERILNSGIFGSKEESRKQLEERIKTDKENPNSKEGMTRTDLLQLYSGRPQQYSTLEPADYVPTAGHRRGEEYVKSKFVEDELIKSILNQPDTTQPIPNLRTKADIQRYIETHGETALDTKPGAKTKGIATRVPALGTATLSAGEEGGRPYLSYSDLWDLNPYTGAYADTPEKEQQNWHNQWKKEGVDIATKFAGAKPPKVYGRIYFDPETGRPIQKEDGGEIPHAQNGQEMSYYQHGLDFKTKGMKNGGWLDIPQAQKGKSIFDAPIVPEYARGYDSFKSPQALENEFKNKEAAKKETAYREHFVNKESVRPAEAKQSAISKGWDVLTHPMTALSYKAKGQEIPDYFSRGETNPYELALDIVNPFTYAESVANVVPQTIDMIRDPNLDKVLPLAGSILQNLPVAHGAMSEMQRLAPYFEKGKETWRKTSDIRDKALRLKNAIYSGSLAEELPGDRLHHSFFNMTPEQVSEALLKEKLYAKPGDALGDLNMSLNSSPLYWASASRDLKKFPLVRTGEFQPTNQFGWKGKSIYNAIPEEVKSKYSTELQNFAKEKNGLENELKRVTDDEHKSFIKKRLKRLADQDPTKKILENIHHESPEAANQFLTNYKPSMDRFIRTSNEASGLNFPMTETKFAGYNVPTGINIKNPNARIKNILSEGIKDFSRFGKKSKRGPWDNIGEDRLSRQELFELTGDERYSDIISPYDDGPPTFNTYEDTFNYDDMIDLRQGGVIKDNMGYWNPDNRGKVVEIGSPYITMEGVDEPLIGISDKGDKKYMIPGKNYKFKGKKVREYPVAKNGVRQEQKGLQNLDQLTNFTNYNKPQPGGWLDKY